MAKSKYSISLVALLVACTGASGGSDVASSGDSAAGSGADAPSGGPVQNISAADKKQGAEAHPQLLEEFGGAYSGRQVPYVTSVGQNIAVQSGLGDARSDFTVTLLNSPVNNAFAIPGGYVYLTRQLMALMNDEAEMAGVLGHEVGHVAARHSQKRQKAATRNSILGVLGQIGAAVLLGDTALGKLGQQVFGQGSQLLTLKFSRTQEYEADDLGIKYLASAGYDPEALSTMLESLAAQAALDAQAAGQDARNIPAWASTHPDPASRVTRARDNGRLYKITAGKRNRDTFLGNLDGMMYGDDPKQGVVEGREFLHPDLRLKFAIPTGFGMSNGTRAVNISGSSGKALFTTQAYSGNMPSYIDAAFKAVAGQNQTITYGQIQKTMVNGIPASYAVARVANGNQNVDVTVFAYEFSATSAFHFVSIVPAGQTAAFSSMYQSMNRMTVAEAAAIKPRTIAVVTVKSKDTLSSLSARMAYSTLQKERFLVLNRLREADGLRSGQQVKIVTY